MSDTPVPSTVPGPVPVPRRTYPRLTKYTSIFITVCVVILAGAWLYDMFGPATLLDCDASVVQSAVHDIFRDKAKVEMTSMTEFKPGVATEDTRACAADLTFTGDVRAHLDYQVILKDGHTLVKTGQVTNL